MTNTENATGIKKVHRELIRSIRINLKNGREVNRRSKTNILLNIHKSF